MPCLIDGHDLVGEGAEVRVHDVDGHLDGVEVEVVFLRDFEHAEMDGGIFVAGEADVADLAGLSGCDCGFDGAAWGEDAVRIFEANDFMELDQVDHVGLEAAEGLFELLVVFDCGAAVHFGHEKDFLAVAVAQGLAHADLGNAIVIVPAVVHEGDAAIDAGVHELYALAGVGLLAEMVAAHADGGDALAGGAEFAIDHVGGFGALDGCAGCGGLCAGDRGGDASGGCALEEVSSVHD